MSRNHNIVLKNGIQEVFIQTPLIKCHEGGKKKKKVRIERKLLSLRQRLALAQLLELIMILCQANEILPIRKH